MKLNWTFLGGEGVQNKKPSMGGGGGGREYTYFLELHIHTMQTLTGSTNKLENATACFKAQSSISLRFDQKNLLLGFLSL